MMTTDGARSALQRFLESQEHVVVTAQDGQDAVRRLQDPRSDLLLLDVRMPGLDGLTLCRQLRDTAAASQLPIALMTAGRLP